MPRARSLGERRDFSRQVSSALAQLHDPAALQTHPLARYARPSQPGTRAAASRWLRQALMDAIASLRPTDGTRHRDDRAAQTYQLLQLRYVEGASPPEIQAQLGISKSLYYLEHKRALEAITTTLAERWSVADQPAAQSTLSEPTGHARPALPGSLTSFIGRAREREQLVRLLTLPPSGASVNEGASRESAPRLLTIIGPAGVGKTRLALETARTLSADGVHVVFTDLTAVTDAPLVLPTIAAQLGIRDQELVDDAVRVHAIAAALPRERALLVLDNFEHVLPAGRLVAQLLRAAPDLRVLTTSREPLGVYGEWEFPIGPLSLPDPPPEGALLPAALAQNDAVRLFVERARAVRPDFVLTTENVAAVTAIIRRLDGLPLAIELAAARTRLFPPAEVQTQLERGTPQLQGPRDLPARQRTLEGAVAWSYRLLDSREQALLRRLGVFVGGATPDAVGAVAGLAQPLEALEALAAKSLVQFEPAAGGRFSLLEMIRTFARDRLAEHSEETEAAAAHAAYYLALVEQAERRLSGAEQAAWLDALEREYGNIRSAVRWLSAQGRTDDGLRMASALRQFWLSRGHWTEGRQWLAELLAATDAQRDSVRAKALDRAAVLAGFQGDHALARRYYAEAISIWDALADNRGSGRSLTGLGNVALAAGDFAGARTLYSQAVRHLQAAGDEQGIGNALGMMGVTHYLEGNNADGARVTEESLRVRRAIADKAGIAHALNTLGGIARCDGRLAAAERYFDECLAACEELGHQLGAATVFLSRSLLAVARGEHASAAELLSTSLRRFLSLDDTRGVALCVEVGALLAEQSEPLLAVRLFGAADTAISAAGVRRPPADQTRRDAALTRLRDRLADHHYAHEWDAGVALERGAAVRQVLSLLETLASASIRSA